MDKNFKIFIGLGEIGGVGRGLKEGFQGLDLNCEFYDIIDNQYYSAICQDQIVKLHRDLFSKNKLIFFRIFLKCLIFFKCLIKYDVFIYLGMASFFRKWELPILKLFRKKIVYVFLGSDSRPSYLNGVNFNFNDLSNNQSNIISLLYDKVQKQKKDILYIEKYSDIIVDHSACAYLHEKPFILWSWLGFPRSDLSNKVKFRKTRNSNCDETIRILHAPSRQDSKGSHSIRLIIERVKEKGYKIEYIEIIGKKNEEVLNEIMNSDLIFNEVNSDIPLGGLGTEAAFLGKPVLVGGYYLNDIFSDHKGIELPKVFYSSPENLEEKLIEILNNKEHLKQVGLDAQLFVKDNFAPTKVAKKYIDALITIKSASFFDPYSLKYVKGYGATLLGQEYKEMMRKYVETYGKRSLFLDDKPELLNRYLRYIEE